MRFSISGRSTQFLPLLEFEQVFPFWALGSFSLPKFLTDAERDRLPCIQSSKSNYPNRLDVSIASTFSKCGVLPLFPASRSSLCCSHPIRCSQYNPRYVCFRCISTVTPPQFERKMLCICYYVGCWRGVWMFTSPFFCSKLFFHTAQNILSSQKNLYEEKYLKRPHEGIVYTSLVKKRA